MIMGERYNHPLNPTLNAIQPTHKKPAASPNKKSKVHWYQNDPWPKRRA